MNCSDARFALAAQPTQADPALLAHLAACPECTAYVADMRELDVRLRRAMAVPAPQQALPTTPYVRVAASTQTTPLPGHSRRYTGRLAMAASIAAAAVLAGVLWGSFPRESLAHAVIEHMGHEPQAWTTTASVADATLAKTLADAGLRLESSLPGVTYVQSCRFRGHDVPHLVVQTADGPVTIMVLRHERVSERTPFAEDGFRGVIVPAERGSVAVLARGTADVESVALLARTAITSARER